MSGVFLGITREEIENIIVRLGGRNTGSISGKTDYLIAGHKLEDGRQTNQGRKYKTAKEKKITILDEAGFENLIREKSNNPDFKLSQRDDILKKLGVDNSEPS